MFNLITIMFNLVVPTIMSQTKAVRTAQQFKFTHSVKVL